MHRQLLVQLIGLRHHADPRADLLAVGGRVESEDRQLALGHRRDAADHAHRRRLAGAVGAEEAERLASVHLDIDPVDGGEVTEALHELRAEINGSSMRSSTLQPRAPRLLGSCGQVVAFST